MSSLHIEQPWSGGRYEALVVSAGCDFIGSYGPPCQSKSCS